jgi:hypothetical protein
MPPQRGAAVAFTVMDTTQRLVLILSRRGRRPDLWLRMPHPLSHSRRIPWRDFIAPLPRPTSSRSAIFAPQHEGAQAVVRCPSLRKRTTSGSRALSASRGNGQQVDHRRPAGENRHSQRARTFLPTSTKGPAYDSRVNAASTRGSATTVRTDAAACFPHHAGEPADAKKEKPWNTPCYPSNLSRSSRADAAVADARADHRPEAETRRRDRVPPGVRVLHPAPVRHPVVTTPIRIAVTGTHSDRRVHRVDHLRLRRGDRAGYADRRDRPDQPVRPRPSRLLLRRPRTQRPATARQRHHRDRDLDYRAAVDSHLHQLLAEVPRQRVRNLPDGQQAAIKAALTTAETGTGR